MNLSLNKTRNGWQIAPLDAALERIDSGVSPKALDRPAKSGELGVLKVSAVTWDEFRAHENKALPSDFNAENCPRVRKGDLLLSRANTAELLASPVLVRQDHPNLLLSDKTLRLVPRQSRACSEYLLYALRILPVRQYFESHATGTSGSMRNVSQTTIRECPIPLPPLAVQKRIAAILDKADSLRRKCQQARQLTQSIPHAVFVELFGSPSSPKAQWPEVSLGEVTLLDAPMVDPREDQYSDLPHIGPDRIEKETGRLFPALTAREERLISGKFLFDNRYLLYSKIRPYLRKVALPDFKGLCSADVYPVRAVEGRTTREFLFSLLISESFLAYTKKLPSRASIPKLNRTEFSQFQFRLPPIELQQRFSAIMARQHRMDSDIEKAGQEVASLFDALVQRAFRGEL